MIGELLPTRFVHILGGVTSCVAGISNFAIVQVYPTMSAASMVVTLYILCGFSLLAALFPIYLLPETYQKTKEEINAYFKKNAKEYQKSEFK